MKTLPIRKAHRAQKARRIIKLAYGIDGTSRYRRPVRFELLGDSVALAVVQEMRGKPTLLFKLARLLPDGRVAQMRKESRKGLMSLKEQLRYFDSLYKRFGPPE